MILRFAPAAVQDLASAITYYEEIRSDLGPRFRDDFDAAIERLLMFPNGAPPVDGFPGIRRARMSRFPYGIFYRPDVESSVVIRVLHSKRDRAGSLSGGDVSEAPEARGVRSSAEEAP